jgi:hypothetical protein
MSTIPIMIRLSVMVSTPKDYGQSAEQMCHDPSGSAADHERGKDAGE